MSDRAVETPSSTAPWMATGAAAAQIAADSIRQRLGPDAPAPVCGIVLGSGLGGLADRLERVVRIPFSHVPGFPTATVAGHAGQLLVGTLGGRPVVALAGRFHLYEGHDAALAAFPVRVMHALGATVYFASNAAGGVRRTFNPGDLMVISDHMNLMFRNPLFGAVKPGDERFPDMSDPYDATLRSPYAESGCRADAGTVPSRRTSRRYHPPSPPQRMRARSPTTDTATRASASPRTAPPRRLA